MCFFSIILPTYNRSAYIDKAINSVLSQTYEKWELIIVDDGSTDNTKQIVADFDDPRIKYIYQENAERSAARNNGIKHAEGKYLLFLDSDDQLKSDTLEALYDAITKNGESVAIFGTELVYEKDKRNRTLYSGTIADQILESHSVISISQCAHRNCFTNNLFNERFTFWEDTHLWLRILQQFPVIGVPDACIFVTVHHESSVVKTIQQVKIVDVHRYRDAVLDLLNYPDLFPKNTYEQLLKEYIFSKYQMYIYQARMNRQYDIAETLLSEAKTYKREVGYHFKTRIKLMLGRIFNIHLS